MSSPLPLLALLLIPSFAGAQIAVGKCRFLGNVIGGSAPSSYTTYWNQVTPENAGKWGSVESVRDQMNWRGLDNAFYYAREHGFPFKQHTFVWDNQQPRWMTSISSGEQQAEVEEWIRLFCERYQGPDAGWPEGLPFFIDVVNEPVNDPAFYHDALGGAGTTGYDWVIWAFEKARQYCPGARLLINEYNILNGYTSTTAYLQIIHLLKERELIDGIGVQAHSLEQTESQAIKAKLDELATADLPIYISEYEVRGTDSEQDSIYKAQFPTLWEHPSVQGMTLWGYVAGRMWRNEGHLLRDDGTERPALVWLKDYVKKRAGGDFCDHATGQDGGP